MTRAALLAAALAALAGCGGADRPGLRISAAASLKAAFTEYGREFGSARTRFSFAASDELAAQIRAGARPDVYAAANSRLPQQLHAAGLVERPRLFASNRLVLAVPAEAAKVATLADVARPGVTVAVGAPSAPVGSYTREALSRLAPARRAAILANVESNEPDVAGVVGKLTQGAVDAGFVYATDVVAARGRLAAIELPERMRPSVAYAAAVVKGSRNAAEARAFVAGLLRGRGVAALRRAGFAPAGFAGRGTGAAPPSR